MSNRVLVLLARAPSARGKTRLTAHLSDARARALRERLLVDTLSVARATGYPVMIAFTPGEAGDEVMALAPDATLLPQRGHDLGERMRNAMADAFAAGMDDVVLIGSDLPTLPPEHVRRAFDLLELSAVPGFSTHIILGPTKDGGFYLVGARREMPDIFEGVTWGDADVLARVCRAAHEAAVGVAFAPDWWDVDSPEDLKRLPPSYTQFRP